MNVESTRESELRYCCTSIITINAAANRCFRRWTDRKSREKLTLHQSSS